VEQALQVVVGSVATAAPVPPASLVVRCHVRIVVATSAHCRNAGFAQARTVPYIDSKGHHQLR